MSQAAANLSPTLSEGESARLQDSLAAAINALLFLQKSDGHWCGELEGDSILASEYLLMKFILGQENEPMADGADPRQTLGRIANRLRSMQRADGTWGQYPGAAMDLSATVKAYFALKLMGDDPGAEHMSSARDAIRAAGGAERCNSFSSFYLACLGQISWNAVPSIPPEIIFLPRWFYFHIDKVSAWTRTMILPLAIVNTLRPTRRLPPERGIDELFVNEKKRHRLTLDHREEFTDDGLLSWTTLFRFLDSGLKILHALGGTPVRRISLRRALDWILARAGQDGPGRTDGLGAIFPPMVYIQIALHAMGYPRSHPDVQRAERELDGLFIDGGDHIRVQPCFSPVWDSGIALYVLTDCGLTIRDEPVCGASAWLRSKQCDFVGDWVRNLRSVNCAKYSETPHLSEAKVRIPAGWFFEYHNAWYPDVDDTAMVAMALRRAGGAENLAAAQRGVEWILDMQNDDGGWAAFDRTRHRPILEKVPFADHNAMQDPSCPDITGRVLECLAWHGFDASHPAVAGAIDFIRARQEPEGCWFGRWGVNYIYGTWQAVIGPIRCGVDRDAPWVRNAGQWIRSIQKDDGSFGESADSYLEPAGQWTIGDGEWGVGNGEWAMGNGREAQARSTQHTALDTLKGRGPSTASQTAWAAMVLLEIFGADDPDLKRAIDWLLRTQMTHEQAADRTYNTDGDPPGSWRETEFTGTGFPRVFYLRYHLYRLYFPLMAIARYARAHGISPRERIEPRRAAEGHGDFQIQMNAQDRESELVGR